MGNAELTWRKSSFSGSGGGQCVEVAASDGQVHARDSKSSERGMLTVSAEIWCVFVAGVREGKFTNLSVN
jgi:Domain of unknown function (DUF397)